MEQELEMIVKPLDGPPFVQYCDLFHKGANIFDKLKDMIKDCTKYAPAPPLVQNELVVMLYGTYNHRKAFLYSPEVV